MLTIIALVVVFVLVCFAIYYAPDLPPGPSGKSPFPLKAILYVAWFLVGAYYVWTHYVR